MSSGAAVGWITAGALGLLWVLAAQASDSAAGPSAGALPGSVSAPPAEAMKRPGRPAESHPALPDASGTGPRVVYGISARRVWLVREGAEVARTFRVKPGTVDPIPGEYAVRTRSNTAVGSDGVPVEHVVRFAVLGETVIGFSAAVGDPKPPRTEARRTGGIRQARPDGEAMWRFAGIGVKVVVVP
ncbi:hypothetical protein [Wenjunlia tyrosinilytica]|uniref:L,D-transpeptidase n=1 Tax=Wenjunlia tyrosinilytica TaxID=1544741 RepID=A0A918DVF1_9ACTN|nr:hypothetical protein [Wenjunlia tyrosinilytica]GGO83564.1 hypothetical protein GCM10012280_12870 [Wenjunlia tyrosinilytica]